MKDIYVNDQETIRLMIDTTGKSHLGITFSGVGYYEEIFPLNNEELSDYQERGEKFLVQLADDVRMNNSLYSHRFMRS